MSGVFVCSSLAASVLEWSLHTSEGRFYLFYLFCKSPFHGFSHFSMGFGPLSLHGNNASDALAHLTRALHVNPVKQLALILLGLSETCTLTRVEEPLV